MATKSAKELARSLMVKADMVSGNVQLWKLEGPEGVHPTAGGSAPTFSGTQEQAKAMAAMFPGYKAVRA